jgi:hypothetical protein
MPDISPNQGLSLPDADDNANGPLAFDNYNDGVENRLVQRFTSTTDRTVRNPTPNTGELSYIANLDEYQRYLASTGIWKSVRAVDKTPRAVVTRAVAQSIPNNTLTPITWDTIVINDYVLPLFSLGAPTLITLTEPGFYSVSAHVSFAANAAGYRQIRIEFSGVAVTAQSLENLGASVGIDLNIGANVYSGTTTDTIRVTVFQNSGGSLNTAISPIVPRLSVARIG